MKNRFYFWFHLNVNQFAREFEWKNGKSHDWIEKKKNTKHSQKPEEKKPWIESNWKNTDVENSSRIYCFTKIWLCFFQLSRFFFLCILLFLLLLRAHPFFALRFISLFRYRLWRLLLIQNYLNDINISCGSILYVSVHDARYLI